MVRQVDYLFQLIKSMNRNEKGFFKKQSSAFGDGRHLRLFDAIAAQQQYDERALLEKFRREKFTKNFAVIKQYLFSAVLQSLADYGRKKSTELEMFRLLGDLRVLFEKGNFEGFEKRLKRAREFAAAHKLHRHLLLVLKYEFDFASVKQRDARYIFKEEEKLLGMMSEYNSIMQVNNELMTWVFRNQAVRTRRQENEVYALIKNSPLEKPEGRIHPGNLDAWFTTRCLYYNLCADHDKALFYKTRQAENLELTGPSNHRKKLLIYGNILNLAFNAGNRPLFVRYYRELLAMHKKFPGNQNLKTEQKLIWEIILHLLDKDYAKACAFVVRSEKVILEQAARLSTGKILAVYYYACIAFFMHALSGNAASRRQNLKEARKWLYRILNNELSKNIIHFYRYALLVEIMIFCEEEEFSLAASRVKSAARYFPKEKEEFVFEKEFLSFMKKQLENPTEKKLKNFFTHLNRLKKNKYLASFTHHFYLEEWLKYKM